jgi:uncharacterized protein YecT (DUF1311 family)
MDSNIAILVLPLTLALACQRPSSAPVQRGVASGSASPSASHGTAKGALLPADAGGVASANIRGEKCLEDLACPAAEAQRLFLQSVDDHEPDANCLRFLSSVSVPRDEIRARTCLERAGPDGPGLSMHILTTMRIDGAGGVRDLAGARSFLRDEATSSSLLEHAAKVERDPKTPPADFCKDLGDTLHIQDFCFSMARDRERDRGLLAAKVAAAGLSESELALLRVVNGRYDAYVDAVSSFVYEVNVQGFRRNISALSSESTLRAKRAAELAAFKAYGAPETSSKDVAKAQASLAGVVKKAQNTGPAPERAAFKKSQDAWNAYRDAEIAFYIHALGPAQGEARVRNAVTVRLETRRVADIALATPESDAP